MPTDVPSSSPAQCPNCGAPLPEHAPQGLCPRCLFAGLAAPTDDAGSDAAPLPSPKPEDLAPHFPQLEILEYLGRGGMGIVYKARQKALDRFVALKLLAPERVNDPAFAERFAREAQALAKLNHPNIVTIHDFGEAGGFFYLLMEYVDGVNLRQAMKAGRFTPEQALAIVPPICDALQFAHERGVVHRDIKPENLLLDRDGRVMIADFGIAKMLGAEGNTGLAESQPAGTPQYMAPEQRATPGRVDHRADIYSLGVVFYEMLTGELPAGRIEAPSARMRGVQVDVRIDEIVLRALEKTPELRYQTAGEFRTQVETMIVAADDGKLPVPPSAATVMPPAEARFSRRAIVGACWAALFPFSVISTAIFSYVSIGRVGEGAPSEPPIWHAILGGIFALLGLAAPFGATILGWIAVAEIRRSAGKLYGLGLAVFDGLLFPLLALDIVINLFGVILYRVAAATGQKVILILLMILVFAAWIVADYLIIRKVWRAVNSIPSPGRSTAPVAWRKILALVLALVLGIGVLGVGVMTTWWSKSRSSPGADFPSGAHVGGNNGTVMVVHDKTRLHYVFYYPGDFSTSSKGSQNTHSLSWMDEGTIKLRNGRTFGYHRESVSPEFLRINGEELDLRKGRVFILHDDGTVEAIALNPPLEVARAPQKLSKFITEHSGRPANAAAGHEPEGRPELMKALGLLRAGKNATDTVWYCDAGLSPYAAVRVKNGDLARLAVDAFPSQTFHGKVFSTHSFKTIGSGGGAESGLTGYDFGAMIEITDPHPDFKAGLTAIIEFIPADEAKAGTKTTESRGVLEAKLEGAKAQAQMIEARSAAGTIGVDGLLAARNEVKILEAQLTGDMVLVARIRLAAAKELLEMAAKRLEIGVLTPDEYQRIKTAVAVAEAALREAESQAAPKAAPEARLEPRSDGAATVAEIELKVARQQLEKVLTQLQETQTEVEVFPSGTGGSGEEREAQLQKLQTRLRVLNEQAARLREMIQKGGQ